MPTARRKSSPIIVLKKIETPIPNGENYLIKPMSEEMKKKPKRYRKNTLRKTLEKKMQKVKKETKVTNKEFARWFGIYCDMTGKSDDMRNAKLLSASEVDQLASWLGYPLR